MRRPDFTGTWRFNPFKSRLEIPPPDENTFVVEHREPELRLSRTWVSGDTRNVFAIALTIGGDDTVMSEGGIDVRARAFWVGDTLAFHSHVTRGGVTGANEVRYEMAANAQSFMAHERFRSETMNYDNRWWMDRADDGAGGPSRRA